MATLKKQKANLDFKVYGLLQKQFKVLREPIIYGEGFSEETIEDFLNELDFILCENTTEENKEIESIFERLKELILEADETIIKKSKMFLNQ